MNERDEMIERIAAARAITGTINDNDRRDDAELAAFMAIFHPDKPQAVTDDLIRERRFERSRGRGA